ncbi:MAG: hypothetical protein IPM52_04565 [Bacteroidetes bacterium]|nr:hypothetical protein [Bacteroidota bacterium]
MLKTKRLHQVASVILAENLANRLLVRKTMWLGAMMPVIALAAFMKVNHLSPNIRGTRFRNFCGPKALPVTGNPAGYPPFLRQCT